MVGSNFSTLLTPIENWYEQYMPILYTGQTSLDSCVVIRHYRHPSREAAFLRMKTALMAICVEDRLLNIEHSHAEYTRRVIAHYLTTPEGIKDSTRHTPNNWTRHGWF